MRLARRIIGLISLLALVVALNVVLVTGDPFTFSVGLSMAVFLITAIVWVVLLAIGAIAKQKQEARSLRGLNAVVSSVIVLAICITVYGLVALWDIEWDLTAGGRTDLAPQTKQLLRGLDKDVEVLVFLPGIQDSWLVTAKNKARRFLERCQELAWRLDFEFLTFEDDRMRLQQAGISTPPRDAVGIVVVSSGKSTKAFTLEGANPRLREADFINTLINVVRDATAKVYLLGGHGERRIDGGSPEASLKGFASSLQSEGYEVEQMQFDFSNPVVPDDCDVLVIPGPQSDFRQEEAAALDEFVERGGRMMVLADPFAEHSQQGGYREVLLGANFGPWLNQRPRQTILSSSPHR